MSIVVDCEVCGAPEIRRVIDLGLHPMCDDLIEVGSERQTPLFPIVIAYCDVCRTAHQVHQIPKHTLFPQSYHYRARHTADVLKGMAQLVERCALEVGALDGLTVLDIGCNDGSLLSKFAQAGCLTIGIEPTGAAKDAEEANHKVYADYLSPELAARVVGANGKPDIITFTNVFAHIEDLGSVLASLEALMGPKTVLVIENHYLGAVVARAQFDTFYHEHPRTYSLTSFVHIARRLGGYIAAAEFPARYGGNIRVMIRLGERPASAPAEPYGDVLQTEAGFGAALVEMAENIPVWAEHKRQAILDLRETYGPLPAKAFPGRAAILVRLLGLDETTISEVYEKPGSMKVGHYVPGTQIPIRSDEDFAGRANAGAPLINFAWHISTEIHGYMRSQGFEGQIVDLFSPEEFAR